MQNLDLVITADTATAHLAGALGRPVWLVLNHAADWRWLVEREDTPWYPTMRLFRQSVPGDWRGPFDRMAAALSSVPRQIHVAPVNQSERGTFPILFGG